MSLPEVLKTALDQLRYIAKTETVFGDPLELGEVTLVPVSKVSIGFAAGGANHEKSTGTGSGTGGGVQIIPVAFIAVTGTNIKIHPVDKSDPGFSKLVAMAPDIIKRVSKFVDKDKKKKKEKKEEKE